MEIELTKEQIDLIANAVVRKSRGVKLRREPPCVRRDGAEKRRPIVLLGVSVPAKERRTDSRAMNLMLTVRSDLNAVVNAMNAGNWKHAQFLAEGLLSHVDETIEEA